jgi:tetratricopeptide (TPR) repeat protein
MNKILVRILWIAVYLVAIAFSLKKLKEPDIWWQLRTGEWIMENGSIPTTDPLSYTFEGKEWTNIKWGYEVLIASFARVTSPECIPLLQAIISCLIVFFIVRTSPLFTKQQTRFYEVGAAAILLFLLSAQYRMTGRPEMISHLLTIVFVYVLFRYLQKPSKLIFVLIPLQMVWSNMHEGYGIGLAIVVLFAVASWISWINDRSLQKPVQLTVVALLTIVAVICNPYGTDLLFKPFALFKQVESTKFTTEFLNYKSYQYWQTETWLSLGFTIVAVLWIVWRLWTQRKQEKVRKPFYSYFLRQEVLHQVLLTGAFVVLASSAFRNVVLLSIVIMPIFIAACMQVNVAFLQTHGSKINIALLVITAGLYIAVVSQKYYKFTRTDDHFGLEVLSIDNPDATADYLKAHHLTERVFSDYLTSSYLMWKLRPEFKSFIDLRDYEVFTPEFFQQYANAIAIPDSFVKLDSQYHFSAYVCFRQQFATLHKYFYNDSNYTLTHLDAVAAVYEKKLKKLDPQYTYAEPIPASGLSNVINHILNPFYKAFPYESINEHQYVAGYYMMVGDEQGARAYIARSFGRKVDEHASYGLYGKLFLEKAFSDTSAAGKGMLLDSAQQYFRKALKLNPAYGEAYLGLGEISFEQQLYKEAVKHFEKCVQYEPQLQDGYLYLAQCYKMLANQSKSTEEKYLKLAIANYEQGNRMSPNNPIIIANLGFLYYRINDCDKAVPYFEMVENYPGLSEKERQSIKDCLSRCR